LCTYVLPETLIIEGLEGGVVVVMVVVMVVVDGWYGNKWT
jgi:hypothetical protein